MPRIILLGTCGFTKTLDADDLAGHVVTFIRPRGEAERVRAVQAIKRSETLLGARSDEGPSSPSAADRLHSWPLWWMMSEQALTGRSYPSR